MTTLVAAPIARCKDYSLALWAAATEGHPRLLATEETDYLGVIESHGIGAVHYTAPSTPDLTPFRHVMCSNRFNAAWQAILDNADPHTMVLSLESDVVPPQGVDIVALMEEHWDDALDFLIHLYPYRPSYKRRAGCKAFEMGCTLATTETWRRALRELPATGVLYWAVYQEKYKSRQIDLVELEHLDQPEAVTAERT